jgi:hypothetical protein
MDNLLDAKVDETQKLELGTEGTGHLNEIRKWTNFLAILGYVFIGIAIIASIVMVFVVSAAGQTPFAGLSIIPLLFIVGLYFFPIYFLFKFSSLSKRAINDSDNSSLTEAFKYMKFHYRFMGILAIVVISIYILVLIVALITGSLMHLF